MSGLSTYASEVEGIADELKRLLEGRLQPIALSVLSSMGEDGLGKMTNDELQKALKLLSQTPSQREKTLARLDDRSAATLILRARYLGLASSRAIMFAEQLSYIPGKSYRGAAEYGARELMRRPLKPSMDEVLKEPFYGFDDDEEDYDGGGYRY